MPLRILLALAAALVSPAVYSADRPNVLLIVVDDQSPLDLRVYNPDSILETPHIDSLAKNGTVIDHAYHMGSYSGTVCTPSRHMIMTGRTVWHLPKKRNAKAKKNEANFGLAPPDLADFTLPAVFNAAGYDTMRTCKKGNSYEAANARFTVRRDATRRGGTHESGSGWHGDQVIDYLNERESGKDDDPFLIYFGFSHPHDTRDGLPELLDKYGAVNHTDKSTLPEKNDRQPKLPPNYLPEHPFHHGHPKLRDEVSVKGVWTNRDPATIRNELGREFACSENIDNQVGRVLDKLRAMGELDNTYVIYTSDHGIAIGRHGLQGKQNLYEHTWRVPMIVQGPTVAKGARAVGNVYLLDLLATICDFTGVAAPKTNEGLSFRGVAEGGQSVVRDVLFGVYCGGTKPGMRAVRKGPWKLVKFDVLDGKVRETQLFHLGDNPNEFLSQHHADAVKGLTGIAPNAKQTNLAEDPAYAERRKEMEALLLAEMKRLDDPYRLWDQPE